MLPLITVVSTSAGQSLQGITVVHTVEAIGGVDGKIEEQRCTYQITLHNSGATTAQIDWIEPLLNTNITDRVLDTDLRVMIEEPIKSDGYLTITSEFRFDATGLSKQDIDAFGHLITDIMTSTSNVLSMPGR